MATETFTVRTEPNIVNQLDHLAGSLGRPRDDLVNQALKQHLETHAWQIEKISQGIAAADRGEVMAHDNVMCEVVELIATASKVKAWNSSGLNWPDRTCVKFSLTLTKTTVMQRQG